ncbi:SDR family NAD(P)-dependent oxidoreductase, partial [Caballeronia sp.]|uniref:SDR family NAD(P)-dependent oxidoreductase n=1 Tax=Caballeronia sp. TaxID=1931223 RepID=UPI003C3322DF
MSKVILITGGSRGIGRSAAVLCGARGWSVGVNYATNRGAADETVALVEAAGGRAIAIQGDVGEEADVIALFDKTSQTFGPIDGFVNNAGIVAPGSALADMDVERMKRVFTINVLGAYLGAREAARRLSTKRGGRGGSIVNV